LRNNDIDSILKTRIFFTSSITFKNKPLEFTSFLQSNLRTINDIWVSNNTNFKSCHDIYNLLIDRRNCISEYSKIKEDLDVIFNTVIFISKWEIWKIRNKVKYNQSRIGDQTIFNTWKNNFKKHLQCTLKTSHINEIDKSKLELFRNNI
jgi:hypothetical protein